MTTGRASKAPKNTAVEATAVSATTKEAGSVDICFPAGAEVPMGGIVVDSSDAGSIKSNGAPSLPSTGLGAVGANSQAAGGCMVTTVAAGSINSAGHVKNVDTSGAGSVKINFAAAQAQLAMPATAAGGDNTHDPGGDSTGAIAAGTGAGGSTTGATVAVAGENGKEGAKVSWKLAAAALELLDLANCDKLHALLIVVIPGATEMNARGAVGRRILYALAVLLVGIAVYRFGWKFSN